MRINLDVELLMRPRQEITDMFSTFVQLERDRFSKWLTDPTLQRSIKKCLECSPEILNSENFWALYWYKHWQTQSNRLATMHLSAYLQEPCYWAASKTLAKFANTQYNLADYFQMANTEVETILKDFNPEKCSSLKAYANIAINSRLRDILRQRKEADICSNWALLRKVSKKLLLEALEQAGLSQGAIAQYRLAWTCFKELYVQNQPGGTSKLPEPTRQQWFDIANLYNRDRLRQAQPTSACTSETIEQWLTQTALYVRSYLFPPVRSLNAFKLEDESNQMLDLPDPSSDSPMTNMIAEEDVQDRKNQRSQMNTVVLNALQLLDVKSQEVLKLYYQQGLTQQQIVQRLQISQATVSRRLVKGRESLLAALIKSSQQTMNISVNSNQIKDVSNALEEWLTNQYVAYNMNP